MWRSQKQIHKSCKWKQNFILVSGVHSFEKEQYGTQIFVYTLLPLAHPSHSVRWILLPMEWGQLVSPSQASCVDGLLSWVRVSRSWWAKRCRWCHSQCHCFWELVLLKCDHLKERSNHRNYNGAWKRPGQKMHMDNYLTVGLCVQFQKSVLLTMTCWVVLESY